MKNGAAKSDDLNIDLDNGLESDGLAPASAGPKNERELRVSSQDLGRADGLRHAILTLVSNEDYARAIGCLKEYQESKREYPKFAVRGERFISYACDLINAIKAKRSFPGMQFLAAAKQRELYDRAMAHFKDLTATLRKIEQIDHEVRAEDLRSTVWVVKTVVICVFFLLLLAFLREVSRGLMPSIAIVTEDLFDRFTNWLFDALGI